MIGSTVTFKCPNCDAGLVFNPEKSRFSCEFCMSDFTEDDLFESEAAKRAEEIARENEAFSQAVNQYICHSCGAEIIADKSTAADFCYYCHNPVVLSDKVSGVMKPTKIIPFSFDKDTAKEAFLRYTKKKKFLPRDYFSAENTEKISGIYYPFWVTDADSDAHLSTVGRKIRTWRAGNYRYTETTSFAVKRAGEIHFEDITSSAISTEDKKMLEGILPYPIDAYKDYSMPYLQGFFAKKRDIERVDLELEVRDRMHSYASTLLSDTVNGYTQVDSPEVGINIRKSHWEYALLPMFILCYTKKRGKKNKIYTYAMNGYTGKIYGELPISIPKISLFATGLFIGIGAILSLLGGLLF